MASGTFGYTTVGSTGSVLSDTTMKLDKHSSTTHTAAAGEQITELYVYQGVADESSNQVTVAVYNKTDSYALVGSATANGDATGGLWLAMGLSTPIALTAGKEYALAVWGSNDGGGNFSYVRDSLASGAEGAPSVTALPDPWSGSNENVVYSIKADYADSATYSITGQIDITLTMDITTSDVTDDSGLMSNRATSAALCGVL